MAGRLPLQCRGRSDRGAAGRGLRPCGRVHRGKRRPPRRRHGSVGAPRHLRHPLRDAPRRRDGLLSVDERRAGGEPVRQSADALPGRAEVPLRRLSAAAVRRARRNGRRLLLGRGARLARGRDRRPAQRRRRPPEERHVSADGDNHQSGRLPHRLPRRLFRRRPCALGGEVRPRPRHGEHDAAPPLLRVGGRHGVRADQVHGGIHPRRLLRHGLLRGLVQRRPPGLRNLRQRRRMPAGDVQRRLLRQRRGLFRHRLRLPRQPHLHLLLFLGRLRRGVHAERPHLRPD